MEVVQRDERVIERGALNDFTPTASVGAGPRLSTQARSLRSRTRVKTSIYNPKRSLGSAADPGRSFASHAYFRALRSHPFQAGRSRSLAA